MNLDIGKYWDKAWQLIDGCSPVSAGCDNCWSAGMTHRFKDGLTTTGKFNGAIRLREDRLDLPLKTKKPTVFSIWNDLFHENVDGDFINRVFLIMMKSPQHVFLVLTKRPACMKYMMHFYVSHHFVGLPNVYCGTSIENQQTADERIPHLLQIPGKKFLSVEPVLGYINIDPLVCRWGKAERMDVRIGGRHEWPDISQVICGAETGRNARPCHPDWVRSIRDQCLAAGVPFFMKSMGSL